MERAKGVHREFREELQAGRQARVNRVSEPVVSPAKSADPEGVFRLNADGMVTDFLFCGPFPSVGSGAAAEGFERDFLEGESAALPQAGQEHRAVFAAEGASPGANAWSGGAAGRRELVLSWQSITVSDDMPRLGEQLPGLFATEQVAYYVACYVELEQDQFVRIGVGSDGGFKLWVNGRYTGGANVSRGLGVGTNHHLVPLLSGRNLVLLKVIQGGGPSGWSLRLTSEDGHPIHAARIRLSSPH